MNVLSRHQRRFRVEHMLVVLSVVLITTVLVASGSPAFLSRFLYDRMVNLLPAPAESNLVIVAIDEYSLRELGRWPWDRKVHARLVQQLGQAGARAIFLDLLMAEADPLRPESDRELVKAMLEQGNVYMPVHVEQLRAGGQLVEVLPQRQFAEAAAGLGHVDLELDSDGVVRQVYLRSGISQAWWPHVSVAMLERLMPGSMVSYTRMDQPRPGHFANVRQYPRLIPFAGPAGTYPQVSYADVLEGRVPPQLLQGQVVLVGATAAGLGDQLATPLSTDGVLMSGVEINANILSALENNHLIVPIGKGSVLLVSILMALVSPLLLPFVAPRWGMTLVFGCLLLSLVTTFVLLRYFQLWLPVGPVLVAVLMSYPLWTWRRLEYTLDYLSQALGRLSEYSELNHRLSAPGSLAPLMRIVEQVLPVQAWRVDYVSTGQEQVGGERVPDTAWQSSRARHYPFVREGLRMELSLLWRDRPPTEGLDDWVRAMVERASIVMPPTGLAYEVVENYISRVSEESVRQEALTRFFEASLSLLHDGVVICDACGEALYGNKRALEWLKLSRQQLSTAHILDLVRELELPVRLGSWTEQVADVMTGQALQIECQTRSGGTSLLLDLVQMDTGVRPGRILILSLRDVTDLRRALRARTEMLDFLSHDLRSPMISVLALAEKMRHTEQSADVSDFIRAIEDNARKNLQISEQFLQLTRVETLESIELQPLDMLPVAESALADVKLQAQEKDVRLRFSYNEDDEVWVQGNHELLQRLLVNLLANAIRYSHPGSSVEMTLGAEKRRVVCEVRDRGVGIAPEYLERIFERFGRGYTETGRKIGLGLRFVKGVADRHGGQVRVSSEPGQGSTFTLVLPKIDLDEEV